MKIDIYKLKDYWYFAVIAVLLYVSYVAVSNEKYDKTETITEEVCEPVTEYVLKTDDFLTRENVIILDLNTFKLLKTKQFGSKTAYYYSRDGAQSEYYTVFKPTPTKKGE